MKEHKTILVLGVGGNVSQGIIKALRKTSLPITIIGACISEYSKGLYMCDEAYLCPYANDKAFIPWVIDFCNKHHVDMIFTGVEENVIQLAKHEALISEKTKALFISCSYDQLVIGQDKYLTCEWLRKAGCNYPKYQLWTNKEKLLKFVDEVGFPLIAKPRNGKSAQGIHVINNKEDIDKYSNLDGYVIEQCVGDENSEYTIGCYTDRNGNLQKLLVMRRKLKNGTTIWAKTVDNPKIVAECTKICKSFKPKGPFNIQLRVAKDDTPICFEMNVRFSGTTAMRTNFGFEDVKATLLEYLYDEEDVSDCFQLKAGEAFRYDEEFYLANNATETMKKNGMLKDVHAYKFLIGEG